MLNCVKIILLSLFRPYFAWFFFFFFFGNMKIKIPTELVR